MKGGASACGGWIAPGKNRAREVIEKYRSGSIRKSRVFFNIISALLLVERASGLYYIHIRRDRRRQVVAGKKRERGKRENEREGKESDREKVRGREPERERKVGDTYKSGAGGDGAEGCEYKNERGNEAVAREEKERDRGRERTQHTD